MGLDLIELVMSVEEHFGIELPDADAARIRTPGQLIDYVYAHVNHASTTVDCITQQSFYRVRRIMIDEAKLPRKAVVPSAALGALIAPKIRQVLWKRLASAHGGHFWPRLVLPQSLDGVRFLSVMVSSVLTLGVLASRGTNAWLVFGITTLVAIGLALALTKAFHPWEVEFMPAGLTVGDLSRLVAIPRALSPAPAGWTRERVAEDVRALVARETALTSFADDSDFVRDLGLG